MSEPAPMVVIGDGWLVTQQKADQFARQAEETIADVAMELRRRPMLARAIAFALNDARLVETKNNMIVCRPEITIPDTELNRLWAAAHRDGGSAKKWWRDDNHPYLDGTPITCEWEQENTTNKGQPDE